MDGTPLHVAINCRRGIDILRMLIDKDGKALNCVDKLNQTPLLLMLERSLDTIELVTFVNDCARNVNITTNFWQSFTHRDDEGNTLMHKLVDCVLYESLSDYSKDPEIKNLMEILAATGERLLLIRNKKRQTPLHLALQNIRCYNFPGADLNVPKMDRFSRGILKLIDEQQKVLTMQDMDGMTPLHLILGIPCNNIDILRHFKDDAQSVIFLVNITGLSPYALAKIQGIKNGLVLEWLKPGNTSSLK
jgi:ankyrin repeat protein